MSKNIVVMMYAETTDKGSCSETRYYASRTVTIPSYEVDHIDAMAVDLYRELLNITPDPVSYFEMQDKGQITYSGWHDFELIMSYGYCKADWVEEEEYNGDMGKDDDDEGGF